MEISRNQACPCGSGKKYKKCCMVREHVVDIHRLQVQRFYERKHLLTTMLTEFVWGNMNYSDHKGVQTIFEKRTGLSLKENVNSMMFQFYSLFMHRYENNLRGIEWFCKAQGSQLEPALRAYAKSWTSLVFRLVHVIEITKDNILFEDMFTKNTYSVPNIKENVPPSIDKFDGTIGLLEKNNEKYYFNGVRVFVGAQSVARAKGKIESLMKEERMTYEEVMMAYSPEVLAEMLNKENQNPYREEDVPLLMDLGLEHLPSYAMDFLAFYKEKIKGKKGNTVRKYRDSLHDFNEVLKRNGIVDLAEVDAELWKRLLAKEYYDMYETMTKTQITDLMSTLKAFLQWMKRNSEAAVWPGLADYLKEEEIQFIHAVQFPNSFFPNRHAYLGVHGHEMVKLLKGEIVKDGKMIEGVFEIMKRNKQSFRVVRLKNSQRISLSKIEEYTITGADIEMEYADEGIIFTGKITKGRINMWELLEIVEVYPRCAKPFVI
ncbi:MAG: SEC-C metal-binding domain-containing protein [Bacillota bacterium]